jgi:hypothetical protein
MDEYNQGWDPEVRQYFRKILNSFGLGIMWLLTVSTLGLFFRLAFKRQSWQWYNLLFYGFFVSTFLLLLLYLYRVWRKKK